MIDVVLSWLDLIWLPIAMLLVPREYWIKSLLLVISCILTLRLQVELMTEIGHPTGMMPFLDLPALYRGYVVYGLLISVFLLIAAFSKKENAYIFMSAAISVYMMAFCVSTIVMLL